MSGEGTRKRIRGGRRRRRRLILLLAGASCMLLTILGIGRRLLHRKSETPIPLPPVVVAPLVPLGPPGIVIHHSESPAVYHGIAMNAARLEDIHHQEHPDWKTEYQGKTYYIGYHYVILPDGTVETGRPEGCIGSHARSHNDWIGICLIGGFQTNNHWFPETPTKAQMKALVALCEHLMSKYHIPPDLVKRHRDINDTWCPGDRFPYNKLLAQLQTYAAAHPETKAIPGKIVSLEHPPPPGRKKKG